MSFSTGDTIVAIATPPGRGGIGVVRVSGPDALRIARELVTRDQPLEPRHATFTAIRRTPDTTMDANAAGIQTMSFSRDAIDHVIATSFPAPHSYTGEHVVELSAHGSPVVLRAIVSAAMAHGARLAEPGEFTLRAFLNGRIDLAQAEAVADLIDAVTPRQARAAFDQLQGTLTRVVANLDAALFDVMARLEASIDFPEEGYHFIDQDALITALDELRDRTAALVADGRRGRLVREGLHVVIVGKPNAGKSSVFNMLAGAERAIVTDVAGTTRDLVTESIDIEGVRVTLVDTAGLREPGDIVEAEGVARAKQAQTVADLVLVVLDGSQPWHDDDKFVQVADSKRLTVINKADLEPAWQAFENEAVRVSALMGTGIEDLRKRIVTALDVDLLADRPAITNVRHVALVERAHDALTRARTAASAAGGALSEEFVMADLRDARMALEEISGQRTSEDLLAHIFSRFCIGK